MNDIAIRIENISKRYRINAIQTTRGKKRSGLAAFFGDSFNYVLDNLRPPSEDETLWALKNINLEIKNGEVVGIIGENGAGKSTLLKILSRITEPTEGKIELYGRASSLLEVGTGFHPDLTGRENVYINGMMMGMNNEEIDQKFDEIVEFAEVKKFIDTPVKYYSSGMYVRLGFSVAAHLEPDILIVDEVLSVGDVGFQAKCLGKMGNFSKSGRTVLYVSHNLASIRRLCSRALLLSEGKLIADGDPSRITSLFLDSLSDGSHTETNDGDITKKEYIEDLTLPMQITSVSMKGTNGVLLNSSQVLSSNTPFTVDIEYIVRKPLPNSVITFSVRNNDDITVFWTYDGDTECFGNREPGKFKASFTIPEFLFSPGQYTANATVWVLAQGKVHGTGKAFSFNIQDFDSLLSSKNGKWPGIVRIHPKWKTEKV
ncbi:MAG: ABC transporter ATP-binding protein [Anaerolineaceae bacterium]|nr:ABC transporter ATP-binding protein [Anaerolineaceae bacterium]